MLGYETFFSLTKNFIKLVCLQNQKDVLSNDLSLQNFRRATKYQKLLIYRNVLKEIKVKSERVVQMLMLFTQTAAFP